MSTTAPNIGIVWGWELGENGWKADHDRNLRALDTVVQGSVIAVQNFQPVSPSNGDAYIVEPGASGSWSGYDSRIARFHSGTGWEFYTPKAGWRMWLSSTNRYLRFDGTNWLDEQSTAGTPYLLASGETRPIDTTAGIRTSGVERISTGGAGFFTALTVSGLTTNALPRITAGGQFVDSGVFDDGTTCNVNRALQIYPQSGNTAQMQVRLAAAAGGTLRWAWGRRDDGLSGAPAGAWVINDDTTARVWGTQTQMTVNQDLQVVGFANASSIRTSSTERISSGGAGFLTSLTVSGLTSGRIPRVTTGGLLTDDDAFTWASGPLITIGNNSASGARLQINGGANQFKGVRLQSVGVTLWSIMLDNTAQSGSDTGARFTLIANNDAGTEIDRPIDITRISGGTIILGGTSNRAVRHTGAISAWNVTPPASRPTVNAASVDLATVIALTNQLRTALIGCGIVQ